MISSEFKSDSNVELYAVGDLTEGGIYLILSGEFQGYVGLKAGNRVYLLYNKNPKEQITHLLCDYFSGITKFRKLQKGESVTITIT